jgi:hypothetical protein
MMTSESTTTAPKPKRSRRRLALAFMAVFIVTLAVLGATSKAPASAPGAPARSPSPQTSPADVARVVGVSIDQLYCGAAPKPDWCAALTVENGAYSVALDGTLLAVGTHALSTALANDLCIAVAAAHFDENALALPFTGVVVVGPGQKTLAQCRVGS